jgi:hypothetical protein
MTNRIRYCLLPHELDKHASQIQCRYPRLAKHLVKVGKAIAAAERGLDEEGLMNFLEDN